MRTIVHLSDIHFGRFDARCVDPLLEAIDKINPHLIVISGDFTQRARVKEYTEAQKLLKRLKHKHLVIPGNHDIRPLFSPLKRIFNPYDRFKKFISKELEPFYIDAELAVAGVNTVRPSAIKDGRVSRKQIEKVQGFFRNMKPELIKIVVTHHPFDMPMLHQTLKKEYKYKKSRLARKAKLAVNLLATVGTDIYLSGHYHQSSAGDTGTRYKIENYAALSIRAGTISMRQRGEVQSFNVLNIDKNNVKVSTYSWKPGNGFDLITSKEFQRNNKQWLDTQNGHSPKN